MYKILLQEYWTIRISIGINYKKSIIFFHWIYIEVNSDEEGAVSISNRQYEERLQEQYSQIRLLDTRYLVPFIEEFDRLIKQEA